MTKEEAKELTEKIYWDLEHGDCDMAAGRILTALNQERAKEVVLGSGEVTGYNLMGAVFMQKTDNNITKSVCGKKGQLIFREQEGK